MSQITVKTTVKAPLKTVWDAWTNPEHITQWAFASADWQAPHAENDLKTGGKFKTRMEAKDGSAGFDFTGTYTKVDDQQTIEYTMDDGRAVSIKFEENPEGVAITQTFDPENQNPEEMQRQGWQAILNNFKSYVENLS